MNEFLHFIPFKKKFSITKKISLELKIFFNNLKFNQQKRVLAKIPFEEQSY